MEETLTKHTLIYELFAVTSCPLFIVYHTDLDVGTVEVNGLVSVDVRCTYHPSKVQNQNHMRFHHIFFHATEHKWTPGRTPCLLEHSTSLQLRRYRKRSKDRYYVLYCGRMYHWNHVLLQPHRSLKKEKEGANLNHISSPYGYHIMVLRVYLGKIFRKHCILPQNLEAEASPP